MAGNSKMQLKRVTNNFYARFIEDLEGRSVQIGVISEKSGTLLALFAVSSKRVQPTDLTKPGTLFYPTSVSVRSTGVLYAPEAYEFFKAMKFANKQLKRMDARRDRPRMGW
jgi:hypothetical protein